MVLIYKTVEMIPGPIRTFWYKGSQKQRENYKFEERAISLKKSSPDSKADISTKSKFDVWRLILIILSRYDIVSVRYDIIFNI